MKIFSDLIVFNSRNLERSDERNRLHASLLFVVQDSAEKDVLHTGRPAAHLGKVKDQRSFSNRAVEPHRCDGRASATSSSLPPRTNTLDEFLERLIHDPENYEKNF